MHRMKTSFRNEGFSLIEIHIAMTILAVALVGMGTLVVSSSRQTEVDESRQRVLQAAQNLIEEIRTVDTETILSTYDGQTYNVEDVTGTAGPTEVLSVAVTAIEPKLLQVSITATWSVAGTPLTYTLDTQIYNAKG